MEQQHRPCLHKCSTNSSGSTMGARRTPPRRFMVSPTVVHLTRLVPSQKWEIIMDNTQNHCRSCWGMRAVSFP